LIAILDSAFATQPRTHWERLFREKEFWFSVVHKPNDLTADPQVIANHYLAELDSGFKMVAFSFTLKKTPVPPTQAAPSCGHHTEEILQQLCGYTMEEILALKEKNVAP
jgi:crotonobetainyl-CoA:carnitine CoA-transferase CaiB-like acyl-CoA transferase